MREQMQNERDNAAAYGDTARVEKLDRELGRPAPAAAVKRAAALGGNRKARTDARPKADQTREAGA